MAKENAYAFGEEATYIHLLRRRVEERPDLPIYTFLPEDEHQSIEMTFGELDRQARRIAAALAERYAPGERVLLLYPSGLDYVAAFCGCLYAGMIAVPAYPPRVSRQNRSYGRLNAIALDARPAVALTLLQTIDTVKPRLASDLPLATLPWMATDNLARGGEAEWREPTVTGQSLAFLQYTSGTTGRPKGVMISHSNLLHNQSLLRRAFLHDEQTVIVSWLPMFHDMGLIGGVLHSIYIGARAVLMSPMTFLQRPLRWLQAVSRYRATTSGGPNFAYDLCARRISEEEREGLDLSSWRVAFNGSEPVRADTIERFAATFAASGFSRKSFYPCYGLAESCLIVSGGELAGDAQMRSFSQPESASGSVSGPGPDRSSAHSFVSCGEALGEQEVVIVNPQMMERAGPAEVGEIWVAGPSVAQGYWNNPADTAETFTAQIGGEERGKKFLRTGDLGFQVNGELFIAGRLKDLIIIRGRNFYPQDIEATVERSHVGLPPNACAAFPVDGPDGERLVVVQEASRSTRPAMAEAMIAAIRQAVIEEHDVEIQEVLLIRPGELPKTSSGKIQRYLCKSKYLEGTLTVVAKNRMTGNATAGWMEEDLRSFVALPAFERKKRLILYLMDRVAHQGQTDEVEFAELSLNAWGLDSLRLAELQARVAADWGVDIPVSDLMAGPKWGELADSIVQKLERKLDHRTRQELREEHSQAGDSLTVSYGQRTLWLSQNLAPHAVAYNIGRALKVSTLLDAAAIETALRRLAERHPILRSVFEIDRGRLVRREVSSALPEYQVWEAAGWPEEEIRRRLNEEIARPFDLAQGPLLRVRLLQGAEESYLLCVAHHIITDLWSMSVFFRELGRFYAAALSRTEVEAPFLINRFDDYVRWQERFLTRDEGDESGRFWQEQLTGPLPVLQMPLDFPRPQTQTFDGDMERFRLTATVVEPLRQLCRKSAATLSMGLLAVYGALLHRYTDQAEIVIGVPTAGRSRLEFAGVIGYFVNTLPLRLCFQPQQTLSMLLEQVRGKMQSALSHESYPFGLMVERFYRRGETSYPAVFQTMFVMQNILALDEKSLPLVLGLEGGSVDLGAHECASIELKPRGAQVDMSLFIALGEENFYAGLEFNTALFEAATARRLVRNWLTLLSSLAESPERPIAFAKLLSEGEIAQTLYDWNRTETPYPEHLTLPQLIAGQAGRTPDAMAVRFAEESLTYEELERRASILASRLWSQGVRPGDAVAICLERCLDLPVALLGILKAGAAYLPLDPEYPMERLAFLLHDGDCAALLLKASQAPYDLAEHPRAIDLDSVWAAPDWPGAGSLNSPGWQSASAPQIAYIIHTSGSTGAPKGVMIPHYGIVNRLLWMQDAYCLTQRDKVLQKTPLTFDVSVWELFWPLITGACLVMAKPGIHRDTERLATLIREEEITVTHFVPSMLRAFLGADNACSSSLRLVICSGEALSAELAQRFQAISSASLQNLYGPTEVSVDVTAWDCATARRREAIPIGRPIANTKIYILDRILQPAPIGVAGGLYIGGRGLAHGYLKRPDLTAHAFLPNPFGEQPGARMYRTGDLSCYCPMGEIEFLGRADQQVKIRGHRIELEEIEVALNRHPELKDAAVAVLEDGLGEKGLVAAMVAAGAATPAVSELRRFLQIRLPAYMIPASFLFLKRLPLNANGKLDRKALAHLCRTQETARDSEYIPPCSPEQELLAGIWEKVLRQERIGIDDNYFQLGGDSLNSIEVLSLAREAGLELSLEDIFAHQTIRALSGRLRALNAPSDSRSLAPWELVSEKDRIAAPSGVVDACPMSYLQQGLVFHSQHGWDYEIYVTSLHVKSPFVEERLAAALHRMVRRHEILRVSFDLHSFSEPLQLIHETAEIPLQIFDLRGLGAKEQDLLLADWIGAEKRRGFDWEKAPLARVTVHKRAEDSFQLTLSEPLLDGWSVASFLTELLTLYGQLSDAPELPEAPPLRSSFRDFVALERAALQSDECREYWDRVLASWVATPLPRRRSESEAAFGVGIERWQTIIDEDVFQGLRKAARQAGVPLKSVLLTAHLKIMSLLAGHQTAHTGLITNGRPERPDGDKVLGTHLNAVPFCLSLGRETWLDIARRAFAAERELLPYRRYPIAELQNRRGRQSFFESVFNFTHFRVYRQAREATGMEILSGYASEQTYYPLTTQFNVDFERSELTLALDYMAGQFTEDEVEVWAGYFQAALRRIAEEPAAYHTENDLLSPRERKQLLFDWNQTAQSFQDEDSLARRIEAQVARQPEALAATGDGEHISYGELNRQANRLAHHLRRLGVGPNVMVGVCLDRSVDLLLALLGALKAGGAYVPLDPTLPPERLAFMIEEAQIRVVVSKEAICERLPKESRLLRSTLLLDKDRSTIAAEISTDPPLSVWPDNLAYMIFTSGSTGKPKAVSVRHRGLLNLVNWHLATYQVEPQDRMTQLAGLGFDATVWEIWPALAAGASLHQPPEDVRTAPFELQQWLLNQQISLSFLPTPLAEAALSLAWPNDCPLRFLLTGGDKLHRYLRQPQSFRLVNHYGPTENTVVATAGEIGVNSSVGAQPPIGRPIANTQIYLLDQVGNLTPPGAPGELFIGGKGLADGYWQRPDLTAEKFTPHPFASESGALLFRTGDLARYRPDGEIEFLGRLDHQVKIRGFRIELGEIEAVMKSHPQIADAVALTQVAAGGDPFLTAYLVAVKGEYPTQAELRDFLLARLPSYMAPAAFHFLDSLPLTPSGKIDRSALAAIQATAFTPSYEYLSPRDKVEEEIASVWEDLLHERQISVNRNFFELGGHSLSATQIISRLRATFGMDLPLSLIFEKPTISAMATAVREMRLAALEDSELNDLLSQLEDLPDEEVMARLAL